MLKMKGVLGMPCTGAAHPRALDRARKLERLLRKADDAAAYERQRACAAGHSLAQRSGDDAAPGVPIES